MTMRNLPRLPRTVAALAVVVLMAGSSTVARSTTTGVPGPLTRSAVGQQATPTTEGRPTTTVAPLDPTLGEALDAPRHRTTRGVASANATSGRTAIAPVTPRASTTTASQRPAGGQPTGAGDGRFHVVGRSIIGPDGAEFEPRGVNKSGLEWRSDGYDLAWWSFVRMKGWGVNVVRLPLSPHFGLPSMCTFDAAYMARVDQVVAWTEALGMLVILDDHWSTRSRTCGDAGWAGQQKMADVHSQEFVTALAIRYKDRPWVAFDLYNEPHDISDAVWRDGGDVDGWHAVGMQQLLDAVRATGATNLVFASGNAWANDLRMVVDRPLRNDGDVVYAAHSYPIWCDGAEIPTGTAYSCEGRQTPPFLETMIAPAIARRAVMVTEFGTRRPIAGEVSSAIDWFEAHDVGWAAWLWGSGPVSDYALLSESGDLSPSVIGLPVRDALWAVKGWHSLFGR